jgi:hypothetical protein
MGDYRSWQLEAGNSSSDKTAELAKVGIPCKKMVLERV